MAYTTRRIPSPCGAGRGSGRGVPWEYRIVFKQCFQGFPLSPALSPLVPCGERETRKRRLLLVPLSPILRTPLQHQSLNGSIHARTFDHTPPGSVALVLSHDARIARRDSP